MEFGRRSSGWPGRSHRPWWMQCPPALLPACGRGREPRSPSAQWLGGCGSLPRAWSRAARRSAGVNVEGPAQLSAQSERRPSWGSKGRTTCPHTHACPRACCQEPGLALRPGAGHRDDAESWVQGPCLASVFIHLRNMSSGGCGHRARRLLGTQ